MKKIAMVCSNKRERENLKRCKYAKDSRYILVGTEDGVWKSGFNISLFIETQLKRLKAINPDAIIGTDDYPGCPTSSLLAEELGLVSASLQSILLCQHKYLSRQLQKQILPKETPTFSLLELEKQYRNNSLPPFPFFIKPVKYYLSYLAQKIKHYDEFQEYSIIAQKKIPRFTRHMEQILQLANGRLKGKFKWNQLIAEEILAGRQATYEGFVYEGNMETLGITDSIRYPNKFSFKRFQYPIKLPVEAQIKIEQMAKKVMKTCGFNNSMFNIEFFYDETTNEVRIIEINPRMCTQFANLYQAVDGMNSYDIQLDLALGKEPNFTKRKGAFKTASSFAARLFKDKLVLSVPSKTQVNAVKEKFKGSSVEVLAKKNQRLSQTIQDGKSFRYLLVNLGGKNEKNLFTRHKQALKMLPFKFTNA